ncbi:MAG: Gfo/Idh/MocA family oxidoreductase [Nitrospinae bacterium]|nr:Gfo/Idh/MocA family oxidoreductase [Nitrospinota bacterium]
MNAATGNVKVAVIGAGYWGKNLVRNFHSLGALKSVCDSDPNTLAGFQRQYPGVCGASTVKEVLDDPEVNAVAIATPAETHYSLAVACLEAGKAVYVEKPLCLNVDDGEKLLKLAVDKKTILMVGHLLQYHPAVIALKKLVHGGELGRLQYIYSNRLNLGKIRTEENILWSFAPHDISVILSLTRQTPDSVASFGSYFLHKTIADVTLSNLTFPSGVSAHIFVNWLHPFKEQKLVVVGDRKMAVFNDMEPEEKLLLYPHVINWRGGVPVPDKKEAIKVELEKTEPLENECRSFIRAVETGVPPFTDGREGLDVLRVLTACQASMEQGGRVISLARHAQGHEEKADHFVHETSVVDDGCRIGAGTKIWHFSHVLKGSVVGGKCNIGQNVVIGPNVTVGNGCKIQNNVSVYEGVTLEDDVFCGPSMVFTNVMNPRSHIARKSEYKATLVKKGATIGANATIVCGITLGSFCFIGAGAVVIRDVPDHALMVGNPAVQKGWMCHCGVKLAFRKEKAVCGACGTRYTHKKGAVSPAP